MKGPLWYETILDVFDRGRVDLKTLPKNKRGIIRKMECVEDGPTKWTKVIGFDPRNVGYERCLDVECPYLKVKMGLACQIHGSAYFQQETLPAFEQPPEATSQTSWNVGNPKRTVYRPKPKKYE